MRSLSEADGLIKLSAQTRHGRIAVKLSREDVYEVHEALTCCPGARQSVAHAVWHFHNPQQLRPCPEPAMYLWR